VAVEGFGFNVAFGVSGCEPGFAAGAATSDGGAVGFGGAGVAVVGGVGAGGGVVEGVAVWGVAGTGGGAGGVDAAGACGIVAFTAVWQAADSFPTFFCKQASASRPPGVTPEQLAMKSERQDCRIAFCWACVGWASAGLSEAPNAMMPKSKVDEYRRNRLLSIETMVLFSLGAALSERMAAPCHSSLKPTRRARFVMPKNQP
jgi:hypothetical protein